MHRQPNVEEVVIAGGGVAALEATLALEQYAHGRLHATVIAAQSEFSYRAARVVEPFSGPLAPTYSIDEVIEGTNSVRIQDQVTWVDPPAREVHTESGEAIRYDVLLLALGARWSPSFPHATTLDPDHLDDQMHGIIQDVESGYIRSLAFVIPDHPVWPLPLYELALLTARRAYEMHEEPRVTLITPEAAPLAIFGAEASAAVSSLLHESGVRVVNERHIAVPDSRHVRLGALGRLMAADRVIALPELHADSVPGIPRDGNAGFVHVDRHSRVLGLEGIYAAGDLTDFPIKHGGIAAQQADVAAQSIAALAGMAIEPEPLVAVLNATLWGGPQPLYLSARVAGSQGTRSLVSTTPLWEHAAKIYAPFLAPRLETLDRLRAALG
jgi:sulfide:quinone oxidoreductase